MSKKSISLNLHFRVTKKLIDKKLTATANFFQLTFFKKHNMSHQINFFKGGLPEIFLGPILNTLFAPFYR